MTKNEENFIKKINELQNTIEWQKKAIAQRDDELSIQTSIIDAMAQPKTCEGCRYESDNANCYRFSDCIGDNTRYQHYDRYEPKAR
jgi:hypothetical protein